MRKPSIPFDDLSIVGDYQRILEEMACILNRNGYPAEERIVQDCLGALATGSDAFAIAVMGSGIWGGSGSVSDCNFRGLSAASPEVASRDQKRLDELIGLLGERLKKNGMVNARIESLAAMYEKWSTSPG